jgi:NAD(P)-dependent dehydrogenase (short-subunit alcohol dehydrogenase family)
MSDSSQKLAVVTGASSGIGLELARIAAKEGYRLVIAADEPEIQNAASELGNGTEAVQADLGSMEGVDKLLEQVGGRPIDVLCANAGRGPCLRRPRVAGYPPGDRDQRLRHHLSAAPRAEVHEGKEFGPRADHRLYRGAHAGDVSGRL